MGWEVLLTATLGTHEDPVLRFVRIASALATDPSYGDILRLCVRRDRYEVPTDDVPIGDHILEERRGPIARILIEQLPQRYSGQQFAVEGWWEVRPDWHSTNQDQDGIGGYRAIITSVGSLFKWPALEHHSRIEIVYDAGDYKHFSVSLRGPTARKNLDLLVSGLSPVIRLGVRQVRGLDAERSADPSAAWLCYHDSPDGFLADLREISAPQKVYRAINADDVLNASLGCGQIISSKLSRGILVYHCDAVDASLRCFYVELSKIA
jgi:hypothetical protein